MGRSPPVSTTCSRNDRPRGLRPNKVCLAWHHGLFQHLVKIGGDNQWQGLVPDWSNISCSTQLLTRVDDCLAQIFRRAKWLYTRARIWIFAAFYTTSSPPLFLLPLKFQISPTHLEILLFISQHTIKYYVHEHLPFVKPIMCMSCENHQAFTITYYCNHYEWRQ